MKKYSINISYIQSYIYYVYMSADSDDGSGENARKKECIKKHREEAPRISKVKLSRALS